MGAGAAPPRRFVAVGVDGLVAVGVDVGVDGPVAVGVDELVAVGVDGLVAVGVEGPVAVGVDGFVAVGVDGLVVVGVDGPVAVGVDGFVAVGVDGLVAVGVDGFVAIGVDGLVVVGVDGRVAVGVDGLVAVGVDGFVVFGVSEGLEVTEEVIDTEVGDEGDVRDVFFPGTEIKFVSAPKFGGELCVKRDLVVGCGCSWKKSEKKITHVYFFLPSEEGNEIAPMDLNKSEISSVVSSRVSEISSSFVSIEKSKE